MIHANSVSHWYQVRANWMSAYIWDKAFKSGPSKICGRQPLKNLKGSDHIPSDFLKAVFHKCYLVHSWIPGLIYKYVSTVLQVVLSAASQHYFIIPMCNAQQCGIQDNHSSGFLY